MRFIPKSILGIGFIFGLCLFVSCGKEDNTPLAHVSQEEFSAEDQRIIGLRLKETILGDTHNFPVMNLEDKEDEEEVKIYFNSLIKTLAITSPVINRNNYEWSVTIIEDDEDKNLFTSPGGHFFIYSGLLKSIETENELMGLLAHELMYTDRDYMIKGLKDAFGGTPLGDVLLYNTVAEIDNMALWLRDASFSESAVLIADSIAVDIMCPFLFDANGMNQFLTRAERQQMRSSWLEKRPSAPGRIEKIRARVQNCGTNEKIYDERYQSIIAKLN